MISDAPAFVNSICNHPIATEMIEEACEMLDVVGYNYAADRYEREHADYPNRIFYGSETPPDALDINWELVKKHPYVIGDFAWTAWDYLGEVGVGRIELKEDYGSLTGDYPWISAYCGDFDLTGFRRPRSYWREIVWGGRDHKPYIAVQSPERYGKELGMGIWSWTDSYRSWSWNGFENSKVAIEVYSDAEEVELFLNDKSLGRKKVADKWKKYYCKWETEYIPGVIKAVAYINGKIVGEDILRSVADSHLKATVSKNNLRAASNDLSIIEIELRDDFGTLYMHTKRTVKIEVEGDITLLGSGSGDPKTLENYTDCEHVLFEGRMIAMVRSGNKSGEAKVTISSLADKIEIPLRLL